MFALTEKHQASSKIAFEESSIIQELLRDLELIKEFDKNPGGVGFADTGVDSSIIVQICKTDPLQSVKEMKKLETPTTKASTDNSTTLHHHLHEDIIVPTHSNTSLHQQGLHPGSQHAKQNFQEQHLSSYENMIQNTSEKVHSAYLTYIDN